LLHDAPILKTASERAKLEAESKGQKDVVFTYQITIGTYGELCSSLVLHLDVV